MKIGADGVLLGAWTKAENPLRILDVGTGSGLIALMLAQKYPKAEIFALDINDDAIKQTQQNISDCNFHNIFQVIHQDFLSYSPKFKFDVIVANLPYHPKSVEILEINRAQARLAEFLPLIQFLNHAKNLITNKGTINMIYPVEYYNEILIFLQSNGLHLHRICKVKGSTTSLCKRVLLSFGLTKTSTFETELVLESSRNNRTKEYQKLTEDFYLER